MGYIDSELLSHADEPPERKDRVLVDSPRLDAAFIKSLPPAFTRRESLLTRQLHSPEPEHTLDDEHHRARAIVRGMSAWSNHSVASTAELTSDNDLTSPGTRESTPSPPLPPTLIRDTIPALEKSPHKEPVIVGEEKKKDEKSVEAELGRPRCITFACGRKPASTRASSENEQEKKQAPTPAPVEPPKRKTCITFACPSKPAAQTTPTKEKSKSISLALSPAPKLRAISPGSKTSRTQASPKYPPRNHRGSDSTVKNESPKSLRKIPSLTVRRRKYSMDNDDVPGEERRFHEFGPSEEENEQWLEESGCYRQRLTVNDTLHKENIIRQIGEEVEEEAIEEDEDFEDEEIDEDEDEDDEDIEDVDVEETVAGDEVSDAGFQTDDEDGFAVSDSEGDDSDNEWWAPGGRSTAATSMEQHLDHIRPARRRTNSDSSLGSAHGENKTASAPYGMVKRKSRAVKINRPQTPDLPDSTDFVCGTLDEDRPLEQAYIMSLERRKAAKHKAKPQDIDPTFPTSDPEMDEEDDDEDDDEVEESDQPLFMHGKIEINEDHGFRGRHASKTTPKKKKSISPQQRLRSPPPPKRSHRSPPPSTKRLRSPAPLKRTAHKSPPPRKLFGQSPKRMRSPPPPPRRPTSPPPSRRTSVEGFSAISFTPRATLGQRPQPTHTASLPRVESQVKIGKHSLAPSPDEQDDPLSGMRTARGAIDIVKGLEKKRQRRKEKLYQKHCQRGGKDRDRERKPKPGKGAERMREVGLELAAYKGKKQHVLSY